ncbi:MAG: CapA family protein [Candidatus Paceibacterota bacterium]|jgi:poly-gamma-glutamate synthesis protein (capsule biosynthesis protein)
MKINNLKDKIFHFIEISISLFTLFFIFYFAAGISSSFFERELSFSNKNRAIRNQSMIATVVGARNEIFLKSIENKEETKIAFVGDLMLDRGVYQKINQRGAGDFHFAFENIKNDLEEYDFLVGNLEGPVSDKGVDKHNLYSFRMDPLVLDILKEVSFDAVSVTNNHINDWGMDAMKDTFERLNGKDIEILGGGENLEKASEAKIIDIEGVKIALLSFGQFGKGQFEATSEKAGIAIISEDLLKKSIDLAKGKADIVVVSFHFGDEYQKIQNLYQEKYSKMAIDFGADLIVGHHPHVVQPLEQYRNVYIAYSLGNFVFDQYFSPETMEGGLLEVKIEDKKISSVEIKKIQMNSDYQPSLIR